MSITGANLIPGVELKPGGGPRLTTIATRALDDDEDGGPRFAVLAVHEGREYAVWLVREQATVNGTYVRFQYGGAVDIERAFLRALGDWLWRQ